MADIILYSSIGIILFLCSIQDIIHRKVSLWIIVVGFIFLLINLIFQPEALIVDKIGGLAVGLGIILVSKITGGKIGMGDGLLLCTTGIGLGLWTNFEILAYALFAASAISIVLLILKRINRNKSIPFIPFLLFGYVMTIVLK